MGWQSEPTHPMHGLFKSANLFLLHWVPPTRPLSVYSQVSGSDLDRREKSGTPGPHQFILRVCVCVPLQMTTVFF
eukprot:4877549-Amphidinium_carterae.1